jgi:hypothetical protein
MSGKQNDARAAEVATHRWDRRTGSGDLRRPTPRIVRHANEPEKPWAADAA